MIIRGGLRALVWASVLATGSSSPHKNRRQENDPADEYTPTHDIYSWNAQNTFVDEMLDEGEAHSSIRPPRGATFTSIKVRPGSDQELPVFITTDYDTQLLDHIYIAIHGKLRDGDKYWEVMNQAINDAKEDDALDIVGDIAVIAPQFFSTIYNSGQYTEQQLAWGDLNAWQAGSVATHPDRTVVSAFDALDGLIAWFADETRYPQLRNVTIVGHGGGGQLVQRYAAVGNDPPRHLHVRYIHGDASSCAYFTNDRPNGDDIDIDTTTCQHNNTWRYGFDSYHASDGHTHSTQQYFTQYVTRDVISLVGYEDDEEGGDESCMANLQGGKKRRDRNLIWYRYINMLAGTDEDLTGFPGSFNELTDWSEASNHSSSLRLVIVRNAAHDLEELLGDDNARKALFNDGDIGEGWRPDE